MFDQLFTCQSAIRRHRSAPYPAEREQYLQNLRAHGYSHGSIRQAAYDLLAIVLQSNLAGRRRVTLDMIREVVLSRHSLRPGCSKRLSNHSKASLQRTAAAWLAFLRKLAADGRPANRAAVIVNQFETFLLDERGLAFSTVVRCRWHAGRLLEHLAVSGRSLRQVCLEDIDSYLAARTASGWRRSSLCAAADAVRSFLRFAELRHWCASGLAAGVSAPRMYTDERLPEGLDWKTVTRLLASSRGDSNADIRDLAILLLLSVYGLRCNEIASLRLDDIDWDNATISIRRPKQRHSQQYPLEEATGAAIVRYIREARPRTNSRHVFLQLCAPFRPIQRISIYYGVRKRLRIFGLQGPGRGAHALRHACARRLLSTGFTFKQVGDQLGHRSSAATRIYAKVDLKSLREVAAIDLRGIV